MQCVCCACCGMARCDGCGVIFMIMVAFVILLIVASREMGGSKPRNGPPGRFPGNQAVATHPPPTQLAHHRGGPPSLPPTRGTSWASKLGRHAAIRCRRGARRAPLRSPLPPSAFSPSCQGQIGSRKLKSPFGTPPPENCPRPLYSLTFPKNLSSSLVPVDLSPVRIFICKFSRLSPKTPPPQGIVLWSHTR